MLARVAVAVGLVVVSALAWAGPAGAHASQTGSTPKAGAVLQVPPETVTVEFDSPLMEIGAAIVVRTAEGVTVSAPQPTIRRSSITVDVQPDAPPGDYTVAYRVVSKDGHTVTSTFEYTVAGEPASAEPSTSTSSEPAGSPASTSSAPAASTLAVTEQATTSVPVPAIVGIGLLVVALVGAALWGITRRH
jgi:hypothetical protein